MESYIRQSRPQYVLGLLTTASKPGMSPSSYRLVAKVVPQVLSLPRTYAGRASLVYLLN